MATRKGDAAKKTVTDMLLNTFEGSFVADKKIYITINEGNEPVQIAVSLTTPKNPVLRQGVEPVALTRGQRAAWDASPTELSPEDKAKVQELLRKIP